MNPVMKQNAASGMLDLVGSTSPKIWSRVMIAEGEIQRRAVWRIVVSEAGRGSSSAWFSA